ncbi:MAG TPA: hypothetical protein VKQ32_15050 [Polyangia bacterium]|nr:hypothetical protein [Polyangia bacterium]
MRRALPLIIAALAAAPLLVSGCPGGECACPETGGGGSDAGPFEPAPYSAADVQSALAQCDLPHGPAASPATYADKKALMLGAWIECPPPPQSMTVFDPAIAFRSDGALRRYVSDGNGGLVAGSGADDEGTFDPSGGLQVGGGGVNPLNFDGPLTLETAPSRMLALYQSIDPSTPSFDVWLVRLP